MNINNRKPFLKWAGGKSWFVNKYSHFLPRTFNRYIEPFIGGGAILFYLQPEKAIIGDTNTDLIDTYRAVKDDWKTIYRLLKKHHKNHSEKYYYKMRNQYPERITDKAARFIYLNRTCWNGLYRVNLQGRFNVPIGTKTDVIYEDDDFEKVSTFLRRVDIINTDFEVLVDKAQKDDLLFVDPPYTVMHNNNSFIKYNEKLFSWSDQIRLFNALDRARKRKVQIIATNANHKDIISLYNKSFITKVVKRSSILAAKSEHRKEVEEIVILSE